MRVRKLDKDGDMMLGHSVTDFHINTAEGVAQCVMTRLQLWKGSWFIDTTEGTPWLQDVLGKPDIAEAVIRTRILQTGGVQGITQFESIFDPDTRKLTISVELQTVYGVVSFSGVI